MTIRDKFICGLTLLFTTIGIMILIVSAYHSERRIPQPPAMSNLSGCFCFRYSKTSQSDSCYFKMDSFSEGYSYLTSKKALNVGQNAMREDSSLGYNVNSGSISIYKCPCKLEIIDINTIK